MARLLGTVWRGTAGGLCRPVAALAAATTLLAVAAIVLGGARLPIRGDADGLAALDRALAFLCLGAVTADRAAAAIALPAAVLNAATAPRPTVKPISSEPLAHVPGKRITVALVNFPPGSVSPRHIHGGSVTVYVLSGAIRSQLGGGPPGLFKAGDTFFEPYGAVHLYAANASATEPAEIMAIFVADEGAALTTYLE